jgi:hypothetical protein
MAMEQLPICDFVVTAFDCWNDVVEFQSVTIAKEESTMSTLSALPFEKFCNILPGLRMSPHPSTPIDPIAIVGTPLRLDLGMSPYGRFLMSIQRSETLG